MRPACRTPQQTPEALRQRHGVMLVLMAFSVFLFLVTAAFSIDVAYMQLIRAELRAATDAAAKAGAAALSREQSDAAAEQAAIDMALANQVSNRPLVIDSGDIELGRATLQPDGSWEFEPGMPHTAVRVTAQMASGSNTGSVPLFFGSIFGVNDYEPQRVATAAYFDQEVALVIDRSHSMTFDMSGVAWQYPPGTPMIPDEIAYPPNPIGSRWAALEGAIDLFLATLDGVSPSPRIALITWSSERDKSTYEYKLTRQITEAVTIDVPLAGSTYSAISVAIHALGDKAMHGATHMSAGIDAGIQVLNGPDVRPTAKRSIVLMSDGNWNRGDDPRRAARDARDDGIVIHTVSFLDAADNGTLQDLASITGGRHYHADDEQGLRDVFAEIARILPATMTD